MVWGSDNLELINVIIAMKNGELELGMTSVMSCQMICLSLCIPIAALARMEKRGEWEIQVMQSHHGRDLVVLPPLVCSVFAFLILLYVRMELDRLSSFFLILIYAGYITYSFMYFGKDLDWMTERMVSI